METLTLSDLVEDYDRLVHSGLAQASAITVATKPNLTIEGKPGAVIAFDVRLPDGTLGQAQATTTVRMLQFLGKELIKRFGDVDAPDGRPSGVHDVNPGSIIGDQLREYWQQIAALLVWKLARQGGVTITQKDMERYAQENARGAAIFYFLGQHDRINFKIVDRKRAEELAAYDRQQRGHA